MGSAPGCRPSGGAKYSVVGGRRAANVSLFSSRPSTRAPERSRYPRRYRLCRGADLQRVLREGKRVRTEHLEVRILASPLQHLRVGVIVPKHRQTAVDRNKLKRQLREIVRREVLPMHLSTQADVLIRAAPHAYRASFDTLLAELSKAVQAMLRSLGQP